MSVQHKPGAPVVGFNHNIGYKGRNFHVQTEDSGAQYGHIITHVFLGGNILSSTKSSYADVLPTIQPGEIFAVVRRLMEDQHKQVMKALLGGQHDAEIAKRTSTVYEPGVLAGGEKAPGLLVGGDKPAEKREEPKKPAPAVSHSPAPAVSHAPVSHPPAPAVSHPPAPAVSHAPAPAVSHPPPLAAPVRPAPPPPPPLARPIAPPPKPLAAPVARPAPPPPPPLARPMAAPRPAPPARVPEAGFGDGLISDKSLDEVILAYLASDHDANKR